MKRTAPFSGSVDELVQQFAELALKQDYALLGHELAVVNRLYWKLKEVEDELKGREGDQRRALARLYDHPNAQVRLTAAMATLSLAPRDARRVLELIQELQEHPQALDAGMTLRNLDRGVLKPT